MTYIHTKPWALYNEIDDFAVAWLEQLIAAGHIANGIVDRRSIVDIVPDELRGFRQVHLFAGIGVWSYSFRRAGISDDTEVWSASCPCQPFSGAGKGEGVDDERHLWPHAHHLIRERRPRLIFGEQVASKDGLAWLDLVQADMEGTQYAFGAVDTCAAGVGSPQIRQRQYWFGERLDDHDHKGLEGLRSGHSPSFGHGQGPLRSATETGEFSRLADDESFRYRERGGIAGSSGERSVSPGVEQQLGRGSLRYHNRPTGPTNGFWADVDWLHCRDAKWRPVEPGTFPLAHGAAARVGRLRGYGNAIVADQAIGFIEAFFESKAIEIEANRPDAGPAFEDLF